MTLPIAIARYARLVSVARGTALVVGAPFAAAILVLACIAGMHFAQQGAMETVTAALDELRTARLALTRGFEGLSSEAFSRDPATRGTVAAELENAMRALDKAAALAGGIGLPPTSLPAALALIKPHLTAWASARDAARADDFLRSAFQSLERETASLEFELGDYSTSIRHSHERSFAWSVGSGAALLAFLGLGAAIACRARERAAAHAEDRRSELAGRLDRSEALFREATDQLEEARRALADRASELTALSADLRLRTDEAASARRARATILANVTHELRTPLNAIVGFVHLAREAADSARRSEIADLIAGASSRLLAVIDDMIDMARIEAGDLHLNPRRFAFGPRSGRSPPANLADGRREATRTALGSRSRAIDRCGGR